MYNSYSFGFIQYVFITFTFSTIFFRSIPSPSHSTLLRVLIFENISRIKCAVHIALYVQFSTDTTELRRTTLLEKTLALPRKLTMPIANCDWNGISRPIPTVTVTMSKRAVNPCLDLVWLWIAWD